MRTLNLWIVAALLALGTGAATAPAAEVAEPPVDTGFHALRSLSFEEAREIAEPFLSPEGKLGYASSRGLLIIHDHPANIATVRKLLQEVDTAPVNIRVEVSFAESGEARTGAVGIDTGGVVVVHDGDGTHVQGSAVGVVRQTHVRGQESSSQFVLAGNNRPARIWVGSEVADPVWVFEYGCRRGWWRQDYVWRELGASLWVQPRLLPDGNIELEVYPKVTARGAEPLAVDVKELATRVVVAEGQAVSLGGLDEAKSAVYRKLLGVGKVFSGRNLAVTLRASVMRLPEPGGELRTGPATAP